MAQLNEELLRTWLKLSTIIVNDRLVEELSYNEALICNILTSENLLEPNAHITATELCSRTRMLKSQMNRTLTQLEMKGMIRRERSEKDRRQVFVFMNTDHAGKYQSLHCKVLRLVDNIIAQIGEDKATQAVQIFDDIATAADGLLNKENTAME